MPRGVINPFGGIPPDGMMGIVGLVSGMTAVVGASDVDASKAVYDAMFSALDVSGSPHGDLPLTNYGGLLLLGPADEPTSGSVMFFVSNRDAVDAAVDAALGELERVQEDSEFSVETPGDYYSRGFTDLDGNAIYVTFHETSTS